MGAHIYWTWSFPALPFHGWEAPLSSAIVCGQRGVRAGGSERSMTPATGYGRGVSWNSSPPQIDAPDLLPLWTEWVSMASLLFWGAGEDEGQLCKLETGIQSPTGRSV